MNAKTLKALKGSIRKWEKIVEGTGVDKGFENCPLCDLFFNRSLECGGCPVSKAGFPMCNSGTYSDWHCLHRAFSLITGRPINKQPKQHREQLTKLAQAELDFLKSLLPKGEK